MAKKTKKRKKLDILIRKLRRVQYKQDPNSTYQILSELQILDQIRKLQGKKKRYPNLNIFK